MKRTALTLLWCSCFAVYANNESMPDKQRIVCEFIGHLMASTPYTDTTHACLSSMTGYAHHISGKYTNLSPEVKEAIESHFHLSSSPKAHCEQGCNRFSNWNTTIRSALFTPQQYRETNQATREVLRRAQQQYQDCIKHNMETYLYSYDDQEYAEHAVKSACTKNMLKSIDPNNSRSIYNTVQRERAGMYNNDHTE